MPFQDHSLGELLDQIAAREPAPGGGTAAALTAATAAALVEMAIAFTPVKSPGASPDDREATSRRAATLRAGLLELAEADIRSYAPVLSALRLEHGSPERAARLAAALSSAAAVPLAIATSAAEVAELGAGAAAAGSRHLIGDAAAGVLLAEAACGAAARLVELNLATAPEDPRRAAAAESVARALTARRAIDVFAPNPSRGPGR